MKKIKLSLLLTLFSATAFTQVHTDANGNVGVGTTTPNQKLNVLGNISSTVGSNEGGAIFLENTFKTANNIAYRWALYNMTGQYGNSLQFWNYDQGSTMYGPKFVLTDNGNVGIGTNSPISKLDVNGDINVPDGQNITWGGNYNQGMPTIASSLTAGINFYPTGSTLGSMMKISPNGNVLIGKISQTNTTYKLDINGKARANEIVVNTTGADFVFENNYKLRPLAEVESFVKQNKHLPEIPTAKTMQTEGMGVSELQTKLLQKVEELTLYLIEKDKELAKERELNKVQNEKLQKVEASQARLEALLKKLTEKN